MLIQYATGMLFGRDSVKVTLGNREEVMELMMSNNKIHVNFYDSEEQMEKQMDYFKEFYGNSLNAVSLEDMCKKNDYGIGLLFGTKDEGVNLVYGGHDKVQSWVINNNARSCNGYSSKEKMEKQLEYYRNEFDKSAVINIEEMVVV